MSTDCPNPEDLRALARSLPSPAPGRAQVAKVRERVLAQAAIARRRDRLRSGAFAGLALAAGAVLAIGLRGPSAEAPVVRYHGTITAPPSARFTRVSAAPDELVVLEAGTIHLEVSPLGQGERFRVRAGDGEVEVRGTAFDVTVDGGHMERVLVQHGRVEVRRPGAAGAVLGAGQHWAAVAAVVEVPHDDVPPAAPPPAATTPVRRKSGGTRAPEPVPEPAHEPDVASRLIVPSPAPSVVVPPRATVPNDSPRAADTARVPASSEHDEERRERRDERRERYDQRRLR
jgi:hypothetical protein